MFFKEYVKRFQKQLLNKIEWSNCAILLDNSVLCSSELGISNNKYCDAKIIVSLTTYGQRLYSVYLTIESLMRQTMKPNKIILWLSEDLKDVELPQALQKQQLRGLEIGYCKDIRSYKKLIPTLRCFPDDIIITADDDLIYKIDMVEKLVTAYLKEPSLIYFNRGHRIKLKLNGRPDKYLKWYWRIQDENVSPLNFPTTGGGTLFPPHCFNEEVFNERVFMDICSYADDIWFKAMALYNGVLSRKVYTHDPGGEDYIENINVQNKSLSCTNYWRNDEQLFAVFEKYSLYKYCQ